MENSRDKGAHGGSTEGAEREPKGYWESVFVRLWHYDIITGKRNDDKRKIYFGVGSRDFNPIHC